MSWFPARTETFILYEILAMERLGVSPEIFPLFGARGGHDHPRGEPLVRRARYCRPLRLLWANLVWAWTAPRRYARAWGRALWGNRGSPHFLLRALLVVPRAAEMARAMVALGIEHVHAHWATHPTLAAWIVQELAGIPYSFTAHAHDLYVDQTMLREKLSRATFAVTISEFNRRLMAERFGEALAGKVGVVRCGVDSTVFRPSTGARTPGPLRLLCVAALRDYKGHRFLVEACRLLERRGVSYEARFVGEGEEHGRISEAIANAGLQARVRLLGYQPQHVVSELLRDADVVVLPSVVTGEGMMEGIPVSLMEALATGKPVVATAVSGVAELVRHEETGLLVPQRDPTALADALERLAREPALGARLGAAGQAWVREAFDLNKNAARLRDMLMARSASPEPACQPG